MGKRDIIKIDETLCNGCGVCVAGCHEGALQMIDGKARIISELYCDGLGACIGDCPVGAISIESREAEPYDEVAVMERIAAKGSQTILAHLRHLKDHNEMGYLRQGMEYLKQHNIEVDLSAIASKPASNPAPKPTFNLGGGCPSAASRSFSVAPAAAHCDGVESQLTHFPVQLHLANPAAGHFVSAELLLAADCTAFAYGDFHNSLLRGRKLVIACPKLDSNKESYISKLVAMIDSAGINTLTVAIMSVPCCGGLLQIAKRAAEAAARKVPIKVVVISTEGRVVKEEWV
ncbi:MAG: 4Fe-4S dicluster domain-containing protein [Rikenellaceae bacterium]